MGPVPVSSVSRVCVASQSGTSEEVGVRIFNHVMLMLPSPGEGVGVE